MIDRILEQQQAICSVLAEDRKNWHKMPTDQQCSCLESISAVLKPLSTFTDALSGENHVTISCVLPLIKHITENLLSPNPTDTPIARDMKATILQDLKSRYSVGSMTALLQISTYLDPRFRLEFFNDGETDDVLERVKSEGIAVCEDIRVRSFTQCNESGSNPPPVKKSESLGAVLKTAFCGQSSSESCDISAVDRVQRELDRYKILPSVDMESDPLVWWKSQQNDLPILSKKILVHMWD